MCKPLTLHSFAHDPVFHALADQAGSRHYLALPRRSLFVARVEYAERVIREQGIEALNVIWAKDRA